MKKLIMLLMLMPIYLSGQNLIQAEYFFDKDPGYGMGIKMSFNPQQNVSLDANLNLGLVPPGFHTFYYRFKDNANGWGQTFNSNILIGAKQTTLEEAEYFFDTDPGLGKGMKMNFDPQQSIDLDANLDIGIVSPGFRSLSYRFKDNANGWGQTFNSNILIGAEKPNLTEAEYFFDTDPGYGKGIRMQFEDAKNINLSANLYFELISPGLHRIYYRFKDENAWGPTLNKTIYKPSTPEICKVVYWFDEMLEKFPIDINPMLHNLSLEETINISSLDKGEHSIHFYVENVNGSKSDVWSSTFNAATGTSIFDTKYNSVGFYPNPASNQIYFKNEVIAEQIYIVSTVGKIVKSVESAHSIDLKDLKEGVYFITFKHNNTIHASPLIIKR